jgi:predicted SprT family Zn-dependent metalloprotease
MQPNPTQATYASLTAAYAHFNQALFGGELPPCLITVQRQKGAYGYFSGARFVNVQTPTELTDEIALNPSHFAHRPPLVTLSTLVHEMVHLWQFHFGKQSRKGYHNKEWAAKMQTIGLIPTATGEPGGKETGQHMTHLIAEDGPFAHAAAGFLAAQDAVLYHDRRGVAQQRTARAKAASKSKYCCPRCGLNAWAKPAAPLWCGACKEAMRLHDA